MTTTRHLPALPCAVVEETWGPHSGCAEFMDGPEVHTCRHPATHKATQPAQWPYWPAERVRVCAFHAGQAGRLGLVRVYRFRTVARKP